ncbi:N-6 DNA methylase [Streptomyces cinereoruber]|uniref:N-6 DNA methylase n=1 Tax=Streptomyces cinereoruber TaxID=67260 RepID=UPI003C2D1E13
MDQLDLFAAEPEEQPTPPAPTAPVRRYLTDLPPAPTLTRPATIRALRSVAPPAPPRPTSRHYRPSTRDPHAHAFEIAEAVGYAWHHSQGGEDIAIPVGTVATLALWPLRGRDAHLAADWWLSLSDEDLMTAFRECWARWWISRPDLIDRATPLHRWLDDEEPPARRIKAVRAVVEAALTRGLLHRTSSADAEVRSEADIMGALLAILRSKGSSDALAEVHTPPSVAELMARVLLTDAPLKPGMKFDEPAGGTGGLYRAAAQVMRERSIDPHDFGWCLTDIDPIAAAGAAVNAIVWDLGPHVLIACGDTLHDGNLVAKAAQEARESIERRDRAHAQATMLAAICKVEALLGETA